MIMRNEGFEGKKRRGRPKVLNKAAKIVVKKTRYKVGVLTRTSRKSHEKRMFKVRCP